METSQCKAITQSVPGGDTICENMAINLVKASKPLRFGKGEASACTSPPFGS